MSISNKIWDQCRQRKAERKKQERERRIIKALAARFAHQCMDDALARLPADASFELRRQVIREAME